MSRSVAVKTFAAFVAVISLLLIWIWLGTPGYEAMSPLQRSPLLQDSGVAKPDSVQESSERPSISAYEAPRMLPDSSIREAPAPSREMPAPAGPDTAYLSEEDPDTPFSEPVTGGPDTAYWEPVEEAFQDLRRANIAFTTPSEMDLGEELMFELVLSPSSPAGDLIDTLETTTETDTARVRVSKKMTARLMGTSAFDIEPVSPSTQFVRSAEPTIWKWRVKAIRSGTHDLLLSLRAEVEVGDESGTRQIEVFERVIAVNVPLRQRISSFVSSNWQWLWSTIVAPLLLWVWRKRIWSAFASIGWRSRSNDTIEERTVD